MAEHEDGVTTRISRRKAIKLGVMGVAGGAAALLASGPAGAKSSVAGICPRGTGDHCGAPARHCGYNRSFERICVCAASASGPGTFCVVDDMTEVQQYYGCQTTRDCERGMVCVRRCVYDGYDYYNVSVCQWPCNVVD